jgi:hypothetical protein
LKTARLQVLATPAFRDRLLKEAKKADVSVAEWVRIRCEGASAEEEQLVAELAAQLRNEVRKAHSSLRSSLAEANAMLAELRTQRECRRSAERS